MDHKISLRIVSDQPQPGTGCSRARCATPAAPGHLVEDNTGTRKVLCIHCLTALLRVCQPSPSSAKSEQMQSPCGQGRGHSFSR